MKKDKMTKKTLAIMTGLLITSIASAEEQTPVIYKTPTEINIDGKLTEPAWKNAIKTPTIYFKKKDKFCISTNILANTQLCWDSNYLYIAYETFDKDMIAASQDRLIGPENNKRTPVVINPNEVKNVDVIEFFITWGSKNFFWELHHNAKNDFSDVWCVVADESWEISKTKAFIWGIHFGDTLWIKEYDNNKATFKKAVTLKQKGDGETSTINDSSDVDSGYIAEIRLPIGSIAVPTKAEVFETYTNAQGNERRRSAGFDLDNINIRVLTVVQDMTTKTRYHWSSPNFKGDWFHHHATNWNNFIFSEKISR